MRRRHFLGGLLALLSLGSLGRRLSFEELVDQKCVRVKGDPPRVMSFVYRYQHELWPDWRQNKEVQKQYARAERAVRRSGEALVYVGSRQHREAYELARCSFV